MAAFWWDLPGPAGFVHQISQAGLQGIQVFVLLPKTLSAEDVFDALRREFWRLDRHQLEVVDAATHQALRQPVAEALCAALYLEDEPGPQSPTDFAGHERLSGRWLWVAGLSRLPAERRRAWLRFIDEIMLVTRGQPAHAKPNFFIPLEGDCTAEAPAADVHLATHWWWGTVSRLDMALYLRALRPVITHSDRVAEAVLIETAGFDLELARYLLEQDSLNLNDVIPALVYRAQSWGWAAPPQPLPSLSGPRYRPGSSSPSSELWRWWQAGQLNWLAGEQLHWHSAWLATCQQSDALQRRLWRAQLQLILPFVDEQRSLLCEYLHQLGWLNVPNYSLTEIGEISRVVSSIDQMPGEVRTLTTALKHARNRVAHQDTLRADQIDRLYQLADRAWPFLEPYLLR